MREIDPKDNGALDPGASGFRLSPQQRRSWTIARGEPSWDASRCVVHVEGKLDADRLQRAFAAVTTRHEILRTRVRQPSGTAAPLQFIGEGEMIWQELAPSSLEARLHERAALSAGLATTSADEHWLALAMPAVLADRATLRRIVAEVVDVYRNEAPELATVPPQYADIAEWQCQILEGRTPGGGDESRAEPQDMASPPWVAYPTAPFRPRRHRLSLPARSERAVAAAALACETTRASILLACLELLLFRRSGLARVDLGVGLDGRPYDELREALGPLGRHATLGLEIDRSWSFRELVRCVDAKLGELAVRQEHLSLDVGAEPERDGVPAVFRYAFEAIEATPTMHAGAVAFTMAGEEIGGDRFGMHCTCSSSSESLALEWLYDPGEHDAYDVARFAAQHAELALRAAERPDARIASIDPTSETERHWLVSELNDTSFESDAAAWDAAAQETPDRIAIVDGDHHVSYGALGEFAGSMADRLGHAGVGPEVVVGVSAPRSVELIVGILAVLQAGGAFLPLDAELPAHRKKAILDDAKASILLTADHEMPFAGGDLRWMPIECRTRSIEGEGLVPRLGAVLSDLRAAYVIYTSGSTGQPKGVVVSHRAFARYLGWCRRKYPVLREAVPLHTSIGVDLTITSIFLPLLLGRRIEIVGTSGLAEHLIARSRTLADFGLVKLTPTHLTILREALPPGARADGTTLVVGGEALGFDQVRDLATGDGVRIFNEYGPTETTVGCCVYQVEESAPASGAVPIGRSIDNARMYLLDRALRPVGVGMQGELYIGGEGVARGYLGRPGWTAERFVPDPFAERPGQAAYRTGDLATYTADGELVYLGRADRQVKIRGHRVELDEIEQVLREDDEVRAAAVRLESRPETSMIAYVVMRAPTERAADALRARLLAKLPSHMVPDSMVQLEKLPLTRGGKIDYGALAGTGASTAPSRPSHEPIDDVERSLAQVWSDVLGRPCRDRHASFFELGGDSIRALIVLARARELNLVFTLEQLFQRRTLAKLAQVVRVEDPAKHAPPRTAPFQLVDPVDRGKLPPDIEDAYPLAHLQAGIVYHCELHPTSNSYHDVTTMRVRAPFDPQAIEGAIRNLGERHAILRTTFDLVRFTAPLQLVHRAAPAVCSVDDLRALEEPERRRILRDWIAAARHRRFRWDELPLVKFHVHRLGEDVFQVSTASPSALLDGWSLYSMLTEFGRRYEAGATRRSTAAPLPPPPLSHYRDFVAAERAAIRSEPAREHWTKLLAGHSGMTIPCWPAAEADGGEREEYRHEIPPDLLDRLVALARELEVPLKSVLLAAHVTVVARRTGRQDVLTGLVTNGRADTPESEQVLGVFLNTVPFRAKLDDASSFASLIQKMAGLELESLPFRRYPLATMVGESGRAIPFESVFEFTHFHMLESLGGVRSFEVLDFRAHASQTFVWWASINHSARENRLTLTLDYHAMPEAQARAIGRDYENVLRRIVDAPFARVSQGLGVPPEERHLLAAEWNDTAQRVDLEGSLADLVLRRGRAEPDRVAVVDGDVHVTFGVLESRADDLARELRSQGIGAEDAVVVCLERGVLALESFLGVWKAGAYYVPLDPEYPASRNQYVIENVRACAIIESRSGARTISVSPRDAAISNKRDASVEAIAYCIYTSGSTGKPKGVSVPRRALANLVQAFASLLRPTADDVVGWATTACFDIAALEMFVTLAATSRMVIVPSALSKDGVGMRRFLEEHALTILQGTPSMWRLIVESGWDGRDRLRALCGGEALPAVLARELSARAREAWNLYGPTETTVWSTATRIRLDHEAVTIGRPIANTQTYVLGPRLSPAPIGGRGQLYIGGSGVARGYVRLPGETAARFVPDPFAERPGARLFRTGDDVRQYADGRVEFLGRRDSQVKIRGFRVALEEIEAVLARHDAISDCRASVYEQSGGDRRILVHFVCRPPHQVDGVALREYLKGHLPDYMLPSSFVRLDALPLLPNGKIDRSALPPPPAPLAPARSERQSPTTALEQVLARVWSDVLGVADLGVHDDFFALGGDSLTATRIVLRVREMFELEVPLQSLFEVPSIAGLSRALRAMPGAERQDPERIAEVLLEVSALSEEEARRLLGEEMAEHEEVGP